MKGRHQRAFLPVFFCLTLNGMLNGAVLLAALAIALASGWYGGLYEPAFVVPSLLLLGGAGGLMAGGFWSGLPALPSRATGVGLLLLGLYLAGRTFSGWPSPDGSLLALIAAGGIVYLAGTTAATGGPAGWIWASLLLGTALVQLGVGLEQSREEGSDWLLPWASEQLRLWYADRYGNRVHGFYLNPNHLAWLLNFAGLAALALAIWARVHLAGKLLLGVTAFALIGGSILTLSRGGLLGLAAGLLTLAIISAAVVLFRVGRLRWPIVLVGVALAIGGFLFLKTGLEQLPQYSVRFLIAANEGDYRTQIWPTAFRQFQTAPVWGTGPGTYAIHGQQYRGELLPTDPRFAHNDWLQFAAEYGVVGLGLLLVFLGIQVGTGIRATSRRLERDAAFRDGLPLDTRMALQMGALAGLAAAMVHSFFDFNLHLPANLWLALASLGILNGGRPPVPQAARSSIDLSPLLRTGGVLALTVLILAPTLRSGITPFRELQAANCLRLNQLSEAQAILRLPPFDPHSAQAWAIRSDWLQHASRKSLDPDFSRRQLGLAVRAREKAQSLDPHPETYFAQLGGIQLRTGDLAGAETSAVTAMSFAPFSSQPYATAGAVAEIRGQISEARTFYLLSLHLPSPPPKSRQALTRLMQTTQK